MLFARISKDIYKTCTVIDLQLTSYRFLRLRSAFPGRALESVKVGLVYRPIPAEWCSSQELGLQVLPHSPWRHAELFRRLSCV